jgi:hypothetical protein
MQHELTKRKAYRILAGTPEGKRPLGRRRWMWVNNIKMDLRVIGWDDTDCVYLVQDGDQWRALVKMVMNLRAPENAEKFLSSCTISGFSRRDQLHEVS